ncbi:MAG: GNAT family N-acetyltransferase [Bacteroidetes bacterium]|nr:GNAT family N-acetyltransferase [Bacteroidota bacterium]
MLTIIDYEDQYEEYFRNLNLEWLHKYNLVETHDLMVLDHPRKTILDGGGYIYLAKSGDEIVGTASLMKEGEGVYELAKMSVSPLYQGRGISKLLIEKCLAKAKEIGAKKIMLYSNSQLQTAIKLYTQYGFQHVPVINSPFVTADVRMELVFPNSLNN